MKKRNKQTDAFIRTALQNTWDYVDYEDMLTEIALSRFSWEGLPDTCDERYLERALFFNGQAVFVKDEVLDEILSLKVTLGGKLDVYGTPIQRKGYGSNEYQIECDKSNSVMVWNNYKRIPTFSKITNYAMRLYNLDRIIDVNSNAQKTPILVLCDENERLTFENVYAQYDGNRHVIYGKKGLNTDSIQVLKTDAPFVSDKIYELKTQIYNEALSFLGIANVSMQKKERLITDEVNKSMGGTISNRYSYLAMRQKACDEANKLFGLNLSVKFRDGDSDDNTATAEVENASESEERDEL